MRPLLLSLIVMTYSLAAVTREFLPRTAWLFGLVAFHLVATWALRLLTNSTLFATGSALAAIAVETVLFTAANAAIAIWAGTLIEITLAVHFARRFYLTMGD